jgi:hypothetical protein
MKKGSNCVGERISQSVQHSPCKRRVPGSSPNQAAHFSHPMTFGAQGGAVTALQDLPPTSVIA